MKKGLAMALLCLCSIRAAAMDATQLFYALRTKVLTVKDYTADVKMKIDVGYMHIPQLRGTLYFKSPDKLRLERHGGLSILPKKNINLTLSNLIPAGGVMVIDVGTEVRDGKTLHVIKVVPQDDQGSIVLTKIWIDEAALLALRTETTTRNDGTVSMDLQYGANAANALPDYVTIYMDLKDYKLPKGVTMDYNDVEPPTKTKTGKTQKGTIKINYLKYMINTGLSDEVFN